jgi:hypothetical protein
MTDEFDTGQLPEGSVAWILGHDDWPDMVTWAPTAAAARYNWARSYWSAGHGSRREWPRVTSARYPLLDNSRIPVGFKRRVVVLQKALNP